MAPACGPGLRPEPAVLELVPAAEAQREQVALQRAQRTHLQSRELSELLVCELSGIRIGESPTASVRSPGTGPSWPGPA